MRILERDFPSRSSHESQSFYPSKVSEMEKNPSIKAARISWENGINEELLAIAAEKQRPFATLL